MNELIKMNYENDRQTTSARALWEFLDKPHGEFTKWFTRYAEYGFTEKTDYRLIDKLVENPMGGRPATDYEISIDMAKELAMLQKSEKGKIARQYFIELEKKWNSPESIMARALKMADVKLLSLQNSMTVLETENKLLAQQNVEWVDRKILEALVKAYGSKIGFDNAWREFKKELLYMHGININARITNRMNNTGRKTKPKTLDMIQDEELASCISTAVAMCRNNSVNIEQIISKHQN